MAVESPEVLLGFIVVLGVAGIGLTIWLVRFLLRARRQEEPEAPSSEQEVDSLPGEPEMLPATPEPPAEPSVPNSLPEKRMPAPTRVEEKPPPAPAPGPSPTAGRPGDILLMRVWQDREGFLVVEAEGQRYRRLFDIHDGALGRRVLETINRLVVFSKGKESQVTPPPTPVPASAASDVVEEQAQSFLEQLKGPEEPQVKKSRISADPVPFRRRSEVQDLSITLNLAAEIDQLLRIRARTSPEFNNRHIRVANAPDGGLRFELDGLSYDSVDEIPNAGAQALIRAAIDDWEMRR